MVEGTTIRFEDFLDITVTYTSYMNNYYLEFKIEPTNDQGCFIINIIDLSKYLVFSFESQYSCYDT